MDPSSPDTAGQLNTTAAKVSTTNTAMVAAIAASPFFHQAYYDAMLRPALFPTEDPHDWGHHATLVASAGLGVELIAAVHLLASHSADGVSLIITPNNSDTTPAHVASQLQAAVAIAAQIQQRASLQNATAQAADIRFIPLDDGATPEQRNVAYAAVGSAIVLQTRTLITDLLCRRFSAVFARGVIIWESEYANDHTAFALALLRDLDRGAMKRLAAMGSAPPPRAVLSISLDMLGLRADALEALNPTTVRLLPRISLPLVQWYAQRTNAQPLLQQDSTDPSNASIVCARTLKRVIEEVLSDLDGGGPVVVRELQAILLGRGAAQDEDAARRQATTRPHFASDGANPAVSLRREHAERQKQLKAIAEARKTLPTFTYDSLITNQLDALLDRLSSRHDWGSPKDLRGIARSLRELKYFAQSLPILSAPSFALMVDGILHSHRRRSRMRTGVGGSGDAGLPYWMLSDHAERFLSAAAARVFRVAGDTVVGSSDCAGRLRLLREVFAGIKRRISNGGESAPASDAPLPMHTVTVVVASSQVLYDAIHALWLPRLSDVERHFFAEFARRYQRRFNAAMLPPQAPDQGAAKRTRDGERQIRQLEDLLDVKVEKSLKAVSLEPGGRRRGGTNDSDDGDGDAGTLEEGVDGDTSPKPLQETVADDLDFCSQLTATSSASGASVHEMLLSLRLDSIRDDSNATQRTVSSPAVHVVDSDDDVECVGEGGTDAVPLATDDILFEGATVESASEHAATLLASSNMRITIVTKETVSLEYLLERDPHSLIVLDGDLHLNNCIEMFSALRPAVYGTDSPPPTLRRVCEHFDSEPSSDIVRVQIAAERAAVKRLGELRNSHTSQIQTSGRNRQLVEREVRWTAASRRRGLLVTAGDAAAKRDRMQPRWGVDEGPTLEAASTVIFDMRELRSNLPAQLFLTGLNILPVTLITGDYVLSPECAVERKSLRDLCQSLRSGRIASQLRALEGRYRYPILLIEFSKNEAFRLRLATMWRDSLSDAPIVASKLARAVVLHPRLIILWVRSPVHGADMVQRLKETVAVSNPDPADPSLTTPADATHHLHVQTAVEMLKRLPGVHAGNAQRLMDVAGSLAGLAALTLDELKAAIGPADGTTLHTFLHKPHHQRPLRA
jgi:ERCC4-type nuclease